MKKAAPGTPRPRFWALSGLYVGVGFSRLSLLQNSKRHDAGQEARAPGHSPNGRLCLFVAISVTKLIADS